MQPGVRPDDIEREKKVILEEIKMVEDTPDDLVHELFTEDFWEDHPLGRPILGTPETRRVRSTRDGCGAISRDTYTAPNLIVVGGRQPRARARARAASSERSATLPHGELGRRERRRTSCRR